MIKAICETYSQRDEDAIHFAADYIRGKGEGQIILLHGPPGTGKTLTAGMPTGAAVIHEADNVLESVAEYTEKPLLTITGADLGENPYALEKNLLQFFRNATKWDAIVLIDEADIYLERRSVNDLHRNSIVSGMHYLARHAYQPTKANSYSSLPSSSRLLSRHPIPYHKPGWYLR